jgi:hypothetical protein
MSYYINYKLVEKQFFHLQFPPKSRKMKSKKRSTSDEDLSSGEEPKVIQIMLGQMLLNSEVGENGDMT